MKDFSFSLSSTVLTNLQTIELYRRDILSIPLSPKTELKLQFETTVTRIYGILAFSGIQKSKADVATELMRSPTKGKELSLTAALKRTLSFITSEWSVNTRPVSYATVETLAYSLGETERIGTILTTECSHRKDDIKQLLEFLDTSKDHPITTAIVAFLQMMAIAPLGTKTTQLSLALLYLYLHKYGYDLRGMIAILPQWTTDLKTFQKQIVEANESGNYSGFIDFAVQRYGMELEQLKQRLESDQFKTSVPASLTTLTDRQKDIVDLLSHPEVSITNRVVQKKFNVSQITASRDLSKLTALGLLYPHGKGRSVYYTRV